jgi:hypothetical protein
MFETVYDVSVLLDNLTNVELLRKGLYRIAISLSCGGAAATASGFAASPARLTSCSRGIALDGSDHGSEAQTLESDVRYLSRAVHLRYTDESFDLGEIVHFRLALASVSADPPPPLQLRVELMRADFGPPQVKAAAAAGQPPPPPPPLLPAAASERQSPFSVVATREVALHCPYAKSQENPLSLSG